MTRNISWPRSTPTKTCSGFCDIKTLLLLFICVYVTVSLAYFYFVFFSLAKCDCSNQQPQHLGLEQFAGKKQSAASALSPSHSPSCLALNSKTWLESTRYGNIDDPLMDEANFIQNMILQVPNVLQPNGDSTFRYLLDHSLCYKNSRLLNYTYDQQDNSPSNHFYNIRLWAVRLIYMAIHYHQHFQAMPEAQARLKHVDTCGQDLQERGIGRFDYECPSAKYLVVSLGGFGLGANIRTVAATSFLLGLATNRVVLFLNGVQNFETSTKCKENASPNCDWPLVSCERKDFQCFFMPTTPCTLTTELLNNAYRLPWNESRLLTVKGKAPHGHENDQVWILSPSITLMGKTELFRPPTQAVRKYVDLFLSEIPPTDPRLPLLQAAAQSISKVDERRGGYHYLSATNKLRHALTIYAMRPGLHKLQQFNQIMDEIIPRNFDPESSIGLPIRASDKCKTESECLSFDEHMQVTSATWTKHLHSTQEGSKQNPTIIFTSEAKSVIRDQAEFVSNSTWQAKFPYRFDFLYNTHDVAPDTGFISAAVRKRKDGKGLTADDALMGAVSSLKFQMLPRVSIGNCCSNFHILLNDLLMEGCGAASQNSYLCLNEYDDPALRLCCGWHHDCLASKKQYKAMLNNETRADMR